MRLPAQLLQKIIGHPVAHFSGSGQKRALGRITIKSFANLYPLNGDLLDDPYSIQLCDISYETVGLISSRAMMPHASMFISIPIAGDGEKSVAIRCRVMRCTRRRDGRFSVAAQFLGLCELQSLIAKMKSLS
jgi:hypothetical protein